MNAPNLNPDKQNKKISRLEIAAANVMLLIVTDPEFLKAVGKIIPKEALLMIVPASKALVIPLRLPIRSNRLPFPEFASAWDGDRVIGVLSTAEKAIGCVDVANRDMIRDVLQAAITLKSIQRKELLNLFAEHKQAEAKLAA